jgi:hypothetical protein
MRQAHVNDSSNNIYVDVSLTPDNVTMGPERERERERERVRERTQERNCVAKLFALLAFQILTFTTAATL